MASSNAKRSSWRRWLCLCLAARRAQWRSAAPLRTDRRCRARLLTAVFALQRNVALQQEQIFLQFETAVEGRVQPTCETLLVTQKVWRTPPIARLAGRPSHAGHLVRCDSAGVMGALITNFLTRVTIPVDEPGPQACAPGQPVCRHRLRYAGTHGGVPELNAAATRTASGLLRAEAAGALPISQNARSHLNRSKS